MTIVDDSWGTRDADKFELKIPGTGVDSVVLDSSVTETNGATNLPGGRQLSVVALLYSYQFPYLFGGTWLLSPSNTDTTPSQFGVFMTGYETPGSAMPGTGKASYGALVSDAQLVVVPASGSGAYIDNPDGYKAQFNVDFATGALTGELFYLGLGDIGVKLNGSLSQAHFSGVATTDTSNSEYAGRGTFNGSFYGPNADSLGGIWSISTPGAFLAGEFAADKDLESLAGIPSVTIRAADPASAGATAPTTPAQGYQVATGSAPNFSPSGPAPPIGTVFAATQTALMINGADSTIPTGVIGPDSATNAGGGTATIEDPTSSTIILNIPSLLINETVQIGGGATQDGVAVSYEIPLGELNYAILGRWRVSNQQHQDIGEFVGGYQTAPSSVPRSGTATYSLAGGVAGWVAIPAPNGNLPYSSADLKGDASLTANFATGQVTGAFTNMTATAAGGASQPWNNVSVSATISGANISGTTTTTSTPSSTFALGTASGTINGGFYGPNANEIAAVWTLYDGTRSAIGVVGAAKH